MMKIVARPKGSKGHWLNTFVKGQPFFAEKGVLDLMVARCEEKNPGKLECLIVDAPEAEQLARQNPFKGFNADNVHFSFDWTYNGGF